MTKRCIGCGNYKLEEDYYNMAASSDGLHRYCKDCCTVNRSLEAVRRRDRKNNVSGRQIHRAKVLSVECDETITLAKIYKQAFGLCALCGLHVPPKKASIDHTQPLSKGGAHVWGNVQLTHLVCNLRKGART